MYELEEWPELTELGQNLARQVARHPKARVAREGKLKPQAELPEVYRVWQQKRLARLKRLERQAKPRKTLLLRASKRSAEQIHRPSGFKLQRFAEFFFSRKTYSKILEPVLRDLHDEHIEALAEGRTWKARWVRIRGAWSFWATVFAQTPLSLIKWLVKLWKAV